MPTKNKSSKKQINVAINGFGRIGRAALKIALQNPRLKIVAINDLTDNQALAHLLKYDSAYGIFNHQISADDKNLYIDEQKIPVYESADPAKLPWVKHNVDVVLECTGFFVKDGAAAAHLQAGAKKVIISAPAKGKGNVPTYLLGVNADKYKGEDIVSMASCTTNCIAPVAKVIDQNFGVKKAYLTTIHSYTSTQKLVDSPDKDLRRARAGAVNMIPTTTGAAIAVTKAYPKLVDKFDGMAVRVPTLTGSLSDLVFLVRTKTTVAKVNAALKKAARSRDMKNVLSVTDEPIVSSDIIGNPASSIVDLACTGVLGEDFIKIFAWYDNEWGYSSRLVDMIEVVTGKIK